MKSPLRHLPVVIALAILLSNLDTPFPFSRCLAAPLGTAFTYQGRLAAGDQLANGVYDLRCGLCDAASGGATLATTTNTAVAVADGLFTTTLDFGADVFTGEARWLALGVRTNGGGAFTPLTPRQRLTPAPYALLATAAGAVPASGVLGTLPDARLSANVALLDANPNFTGQPAFNGGTSGSTPPFTVDSTNRVSNLNADLLDGLEKSGFWQVNGNGGHPAEARFLGTTELEPVEIRVNNMRALRVEFAGDSDDSNSEADGAPNLIGGSPGNFVGRDVVGATIAGGGATNYSYYGASSNSIRSSFGAIGGGHGNEIRADASGATIGGGVLNSVGGPYATIPGGYANSATNGSFAAGTRAKAIHRGSFVWADSSGGDFTSDNENSVRFRCANGVEFTSGSGALGQVVWWQPGMTAWEFTTERPPGGTPPVKSADVLDKVARLPISVWSYQGYSQRHIGPTAQDFHALFALNDRDDALSSADLAGVALAAIQGLNEKVEVRSRESEDRIQKLEAENAELRIRLKKLEALLSPPAQR